LVTTSTSFRPMWRLLPPQRNPLLQKTVVRKRTVTQNLIDPNRVILNRCTQVILRVLALPRIRVITNSP